MKAFKLVPSPVNPDWLIPEGWEQILGTNIDYRLGNFALRIWRVQFNQHARLVEPADFHLHHQHQILYYQRGSGLLTANGAKYEISTGSIFFVPAGCRHHFVAHEGDPVICLAIDFSVDETSYASLDFSGLPMDSEMAVLLSLLHTDQARPFPLCQFDQRLVDQCVLEIVEENDGRELGYASLIQALLLRLIAICLRGTQRALGFGEHFRHTSWRHHLVAERATSLIRQHALRNPELTLTEAARLCGTSFNHLNRILRKQSGNTFHQLLLRERLERALAILRKGEMNITEAAFQSGFNDSNYFSRIFRKTYGFSPSEIGR